MMLFEERKARFRCLNQQYVRIQARYSGKSGKPVGVFGANCYLFFAERFSPEDRELFLRTAVWFKANLPIPPFYDLENPEKNNPQDAITYFKRSAIPKYLEKILVLIGLLEKYDVPYDVVETNYVGEVIYEDEYQIGVI
jgi:hypothetical protein